MRLVAVAASCFILLSQGACHRLLKKKNSDMWRGDKQEIEYDISSFTEDQNLKSGKNPVAVLTRDLEAGSMGTCTAFAIAKNKVMTNNHCVQDEDTAVVARAEDIKLYFRNPGDKRSTEISVSRILEHVDIATKPDYLVFKYEQDQDWAILETEQELSAFSPVELQKSFAGEAFFSNPEKLTVPRINPPNAYTSRWVLDPQPLRISFAEMLKDEEYMDIINKKAVADCKTKSATVDQKACDTETVDEQEAIAHLPQMTTFLADGTVRHGNSGSPVFYKGKVYGIVFAGLFKSYHDESSDTRDVMLQLFNNISDDLAKFGL